MLREALRVYRGHASEKPELPTALAETGCSGIRFLGPPAAAMAALGDKIGSTILAQAAGVPTIPWSGTGVELDFASCGGVIPPDTYNKVSSCFLSLLGPGGGNDRVLVSPHEHHGAPSGGSCFPLLLGPGNCTDEVLEREVGVANCKSAVVRHRVSRVFLHQCLS